MFRVKKLNWIQKQVCSRMALLMSNTYLKSLYKLATSVKIILLVLALLILLKMSCYKSLIESTANSIKILLIVLNYGKVGRL